MKKLIYFFIVLVLGVLAFFYYQFGITSLYGVNGLGKIPVSCMYCQYKNRWDDKYCWKCGKQTYPLQKCPSCGYENVLTDTYCVQCAKELPPLSYLLQLKRWIIKKRAGMSIAVQKPLSQEDSPVVSFIRTLFNHVTEKPEPSRAPVSSRVEKKPAAPPRQELITITWRKPDNSKKHSIYLKAENKNPTGVNVDIRVAFSNFWTGYKDETTVRMSLQPNSFLEKEVYLPSYYVPKQKASYDSNYSVDKTEIVTFQPWG
ncbi:MAG: zinc ribbon domain-containing protein [Candidatus Aureabacteria bacterium]|nr:zinc ribbon domain-containing protein [Candidatus Auribacterota bacterium]